MTLWVKVYTVKIRRMRRPLHGTILSYLSVWKSVTICPTCVGSLSCWNYICQPTFREILSSGSKSWSRKFLYIALLRFPSRILSPNTNLPPISSQHIFIEKRVLWNCKSFFSSLDMFVMQISVIGIKSSFSKMQAQKENLIGDSIFV